METTNFDRTLTELDHLRLTNLVRRARQDDAPPARLEQIEDALDAACVVPSRAVDPDVVTMYSQVMLRDVDDGQTRRLTVCYPGDAQPDEGFVSVLSPIGWSLLGQRVGALVRWPTPDGGSRVAELVALLFQPEASGDYVL